MTSTERSRESGFQIQDDLVNRLASAGRADPNQRGQDTQPGTTVPSRCSVIGPTDSSTNSCSSGGVPTLAKTLLVTPRECCRIAERPPAVVGVSSLGESRIVEHVELDLDLEACSASGG